MTYTEIQKKHQKIIHAILHGELLDGITLLEKLLNSLHNSLLFDQIRALKMTYKNMLTYTFKYSNDPEREKIYTNLQRSLLELSDKIKEGYLFSRELTNSYHSQCLNNEIKFLKDLNTDELLEQYSQVPDTELNPQSSITNQKNIRQNKFFRLFWLNESYSDTTDQVLRSILDFESEHWQPKAQLISAVTLSVLRHFDSKIVNLLYDTYLENNNPQISQRALIGFVLALMKHENRLLYHPDIIQRIKAVPDNKKFQEDILTVLIQFSKAQDTEAITRKIREEIMPEVMKIRSELEDKLNLDDLLSKEMTEEKNPEWKNVFKDSPDVYDKLEEFSKMQTEGIDVFMGAFALLKQFPFFKEISNWFLPFDREQYEVVEIIESLKDSFDSFEFAEALDESSILCNSDKYSFILNLAFIPEQQRKNMLELFKMELKSMNEVTEDEFKLDGKQRIRVITTQYMQDLYRFFKLYTYKNEFEDIFEHRFNVLDSPFLNQVFDDWRSLEKLAEFFFSRDKYQDALPIFINLNSRKQSFELLEKIGFCYQKLAQYSKAIDHYKQAELYDTNKIWLIKKLGFCYRKTGQFELAIKNYKKLEANNPDDLEVLTYLGNLYLDMKNYDMALKFYFKVEYLKPDNIKIQRPIAWCSFMQGHGDQAINYFRKVAVHTDDKNDFLNLAHAQWCFGDLSESLEDYKKAYKLSGNNKEWFRNAMRNDSKYLEKFGIESINIRLVIDYILIMEIESFD